MPGLSHRKANRRRPPKRARNRVRPYLEELEPRTVFAVGAAALPAALAAPQISPFPTLAPNAVFQPSAFPFTTGSGSALGNGSTVLNGINPFALGQLGASSGGLNPGGANLLAIAPPLTTSLGEPLSSSTSPVIVIEPQSPNVSPATLTPESLPLSSSANLNVLDPAAYLLARGLNSALKAGNLPSLLVMQSQGTVMEPGGNAGGGGDNPLNNVGRPAPAEAPPPDNQDQMQQRIQEAIRLLTSARPVAPDGDAAPDAATPLGEPQAVAVAEAPSGALAADGDW